ncbi:MAG: hypothetical protein H6716_28900 [Polyangiaceae bacterium]|nr:hypothetical protein [Polyangiaceae bacterium]
MHSSTPPSNHGTAVGWNSQSARQLRDSIERSAIAINCWRRDTPLLERVRLAIFGAVTLDPLARVVTPPACPLTKSKR